MDQEVTYDKLLDYLRNLEKVAIAFSGGVDSSFLLKAATDALRPENILALTINSPYIPDWEIEEARMTTGNLGVQHIIVNSPIPEQIRNNPKDRCYLCKTFIFNMLAETASQHGFTRLIEGTNFDDTRLHRPGMKALDELGIISPLKETGFSKRQIRSLSKAAKLDTWDKPAYACLLTRIPYDTKIEDETLRRIEKSELYLFELGLRSIRVRVHGDLARIETDRSRFEEIFNNKLFDRISTQLKRYGFTHVTLDLEGIRTGSFDPLKPPSLMHRQTNDQRQKSMIILHTLNEPMGVRRPGTCCGCGKPATRNHTLSS